MVKNPPAKAGDAGDVSLIPRSGRSPGGGKNTRILWYSCPENPMDRGVWRATVSPCGKESDTTDHTCNYPETVLSMNVRLWDVRTPLSLLKVEGKCSG